MTWRRYEIDFGDRVPRIGSGRRFVWARDEGKRVRLETVGVNGRVVKSITVPRSTFEALPVIRELPIERIDDGRPDEV